jgi:hypothetical protein
VPIGAKLDRGLERHRRCKRARDEFAAGFAARPIGDVAQKRSDHAKCASGDFQHVPRRPGTEIGVTYRACPTHQWQPDVLTRRRRRDEDQKIRVLTEDLMREMGNARLDMAECHRDVHHAGDIAQAGTAIDEMHRFAFTAP